MEIWMPMIGFSLSLVCWKFLGQSSFRWLANRSSLCNVFKSFDEISQRKFHPNGWTFVESLHMKRKLRLVIRVCGLAGGRSRKKKKTNEQEERKKINHEDKVCFLDFSFFVTHLDPFLCYKHAWNEEKNRFVFF